MQIHVRIFRAWLARRSPLLSALCTSAPVAVLLACGGGDSSSAQPETLAGSYTVASVNGKPLPQAIDSQAGTSYMWVRRAVSGVVVISSTGQFTASYTWRDTANYFGNISGDGGVGTATGTVAVDAQGRITFTPNLSPKNIGKAPLVTGRLDGRTLILEAALGQEAPEKWRGSIVTVRAQK